jgi:hypothetical protein
VLGEQRVAVDALDLGLAQQAQAEGRSHERAGANLVVVFGQHREPSFAPRNFREGEAVAGGAVVGVVSA